MRNFTIHSADALPDSLENTSLEIFQVLPGFFRLTRGATANPTLGYMWMVSTSANNYTAYYVLTQGTSFPINLNDQLLIFSMSKEFEDVTTPYAFWKKAAALLDESMQDVVRAVQQETNVPWPGGDAL